MEHHEGVIYRAANFREIGVSGGSLHGNTYRRNGGHDQLNPDYLHSKRAFIYEFSRPLAEQEKAKARTEWASLRPSRNGKSSNEFSKM